MPPGDPAALAGAIARLDADPAEARRQGVAARASYERRYTPEANLAMLEAVYQDVAPVPVGPQA